jgi:hypothetical protein
VGQLRLGFGDLRVGLARRLAGPSSHEQHDREHRTAAPLFRTNGASSMPAARITRFVGARRSVRTRVISRSPASCARTGAPCSHTRAR